MSEKLHIGAMGAGPGNFKALRSDNLKLPNMTECQKTSLIGLLRDLPSKAQAQAEFLALTD